MSDVTRLLEAVAGGNRKAAADLLPLVYDELRKLAAARLAAEAPGHSLNPTALVHEAYLRLVGDKQFDGRGHFFAAAAAIDDPSARAALVNDRCGEDAALRDRVNVLLAANDRAAANGGTASFGGSDGLDAPPTADFPGKDEHVGAILAGKYKLVEEI